MYQILFIAILNRRAHRRPRPPYNHYVVPAPGRPHGYLPQAGPDPATGWQSWTSERPGGQRPGLLQKEPLPWPCWPGSWGMGCCVFSLFSFGQILRKVSQFVVKYSYMKRQLSPRYEGCAAQDVMKDLDKWTQESTEKVLKISWRC